MAQPHRYLMPANIELEDKLAWGLTTRQLVILGVAGFGLYLAFGALGGRVPVGTFVIGAAPVAAAAVLLALTTRDGISTDRWVLAALAHWVRTRRPPRPADPDTAPDGVAAGRGRLRVPAVPVVLVPRGVGAAGDLGIIDVGRDGLAAVAAVSTVAFRLLGPGEQARLIAIFGGWLNSLTAPAHIVVRTLPLNLDDKIDALDQAAEDLPHLALAAAATAHADHLYQLGETHALLCRHVLLVFREPPPPGPVRDEDHQAARDRVALTRLAHRVAEAVDLLAGAGITVTALDADQAAVLDTACHPDLMHPPTTPDPELGAGSGDPHGDPTGPDTPDTVGGGAGEQGWHPLLDALLNGGERDGGELR